MQKLISNSYILFEKYIYDHQINHLHQQHYPLALENKSAIYQPNMRNIYIDNICGGPQI